MKKIIINLVLLLSIICTASFSYAEGAQLGATIEVSTNVTEVSIGDKVIFTLVIRDIENSTMNGEIAAIGGKVVYDANFFELDSTNGLNLSDNGMFDSSNTLKEGNTIGTITLKVKEGATGSATVTFTDLEATDGRLEDMDTLGLAKTEEQAYTITLKTAQEPTTPPTGDTTGGEEGKTENVIPEQDQNETTDGDKKEDNTTTGGTKLPQTGIGLGVTVGLMVIVAMGVFAYLKYGKLRDIK